MRANLQHLKLFLMLLPIGLSGVFFTSCDDDDKPKTEPIVTTTAVTEITTTSAKGGGNITSDGNSAVTASGLVYSSVVTQPTIADDKTVTTATTGTFTSTIEGLAPSTTYHVRAYATNGVGTSYGSVVDFTTSNEAPVATNLLVSGTAKVGEEVTATYTYTDVEGDEENGSTFKWYVATSGTGTGETVIDGETSSTYTIRDEDENKFIRFGVTPKANTGNTIGIETKSTFAGPVGEATTVTFMYNGQEVTYGVINSTTTGKRWLDRNLGASGAATAVDNFQNYGDLFQWGRLADGHQLINRAGLTNAEMSGVTGTTSPDTPYEYSLTDVPPNSLFIIIPNGEAPVDWRTPQNGNLWQGVNGINNPCPTGWRIPTQAEWEAEGLTSLADGYTELKLTLTGVRRFTGAFAQSTLSGNYWSSTVGTTTDPTGSVVITLNAGFATAEQSRSQGYACRCIKD